MQHLYRSTENKLLGGVMGGIAQYTSLDPVVVRLLAILIALVTGIVPFALVYLLAVIVVPKRETT